MSYWNNSDYFLYVSENRKRLQQIFFVLAFISLLLDFWFNVSITQAGQNPLLNQDADPVYLLLMGTGVPQFISGTAAPWFDGLLLFSCLASVVFTRYIIFPALFCVLYFLHFTTFNMIAGHHYTNIGVLIISFCFIFSKKEYFSFVFTTCRFLFCFMMFSAACWKIVRGNILYPDQTNMLLIRTHLEILLHQKTSKTIGLLKWLIQHKNPAHLIWIFLIFLEGIFVLGFFSFKWDKLLLIAYLLFFLGGWVIFNIYNYENLLFLLTLRPLLVFTQKNAQDRKLITHKKNPRL